MAVKPIPNDTGRREQRNNAKESLQDALRVEFWPKRCGGGRLALKPIPKSTGRREQPSHAEESLQDALCVEVWQKYCGGAGVWP